MEAAFIIPKIAKKSVEEEAVSTAPVEKPSKAKGSKAGKPKILQQTIISPKGKFTQFFWKRYYLLIRLPNIITCIFLTTNLIDLFLDVKLSKFTINYKVKLILHYQDSVGSCNSV